ncbi:hypothetical protein [Halalkalicoccus jeotgali]|uniref:Uncharacterized protein n=1 Tax=Halalkalicoccus jeotgali (strain DSM 18796 / CECT 7217 / JCM 14584 / KCTC 4019 / B3) TaxID=795797 RepID=D8J3P0_HALJB|nr:hypothetical protein [Halalkalicoccus jeotgali]ADJ15347.1 hypothetical protein HacjB3_09820 [Halalkalicoccus jeotgali B3]ELY35440.1 hypothetical protein C497_12856 [Halalkalicoccus jeotgali B3]
MTATIPVAVPRKGRPLEAVLDRLAARMDATEVADEICSTLRYEKSITKGTAAPDRDVYERLAAYSDLTDPARPEYTLLRDDRDGKPRRVVFDSLTLSQGDLRLQLVGREEPFRALRTHEFALGFDSADLVLEEVVSLEPEPLSTIADINERIDPRDTDVRVVAGLGDTVHHTLLGRPDVVPNGEGEPRPSREFLRGYDGSLCISPRYERLVRAVLGTDVVENITFEYPTTGREEEADIADVGLGVYLTVTGSTARDHGLDVGERLFPSETVLMENIPEAGHEAARRAKALFDGTDIETEISV